MRFTNDIRRQIVSAVLADIPKINYKAKMTARAVEIGVAAMPNAAQALWKKSETRQYVRTQSHYICCISVRVPGLLDWDDKKRIEDDAEFQQHHTAYEKQRDERDSLKDALTANLASCSSSKQFIERYPELAKYAPKEDAPAANLPATKSLVTALKAAGLQLEAA